MSDDLDLLAERALHLVQPNTIVGLGSGRAASACVRALGRRAQAGLRVTCVATSEATAELGRQVGLTLVELGDAPLDITVDGADEIDPELNAIKGFGGTLARERVVAAASRHQVLLVGAEKLVSRLGARGGLPVEVLPFAARFCAFRISGLGLKPEVRVAGGRPLLTDNGNYTLDCGTGPIADAPGLERDLRSIAGVVDTGLFLGTASLVLVAESGRVREIRRC